MASLVAATSGAFAVPADSITLERVTAADRRFTSWLLIAFGPLFVFGGLLLAFHIEGAVLVFVGLAMLVTGVLLRTRLRLVAAVTAGGLVFAALFAQMLIGLR